MTRRPTCARGVGSVPDAFLLRFTGDNIGKTRAKVA